MSHRRPQQFVERISTATRRMSPGSDQGLVRNASPTPPPSLRQASEDDGSVTEISFSRDRFPSTGVLSTVPSTFELTLFPVDGSARVRLNGITLDELYDYNITENVITFVAGVVEVGDVVDVRYAFRDASVEEIPSSITGSTQAKSSTPTTSLSCTIPSARVVNDLLVAFVTRGVSPVTPAGWTLVDTVGTVDYKLACYRKYSDGTETTQTFTQGDSQVMGAVIVCVHGASLTDPIQQLADDLIPSTQGDFDQTIPRVNALDGSPVLYGILYDGPTTSTDVIGAVPAGLSVLQNVNVNSGDSDLMVIQEYGASPTPTRLIRGTTSDTQHVWAFITVAV